MGAKPRWLNPDEQRAWQGYRQMSRRLEAKLSRDLAADSGLSMQDYDVLSALTDDAGGRCSAKELGEHLLWSLSRLSHHLDRMEQRGLVRRESRDGRGVDAVLTRRGRSAIEAAAPGHVAAVREAFVDRLTATELAMLARLSEKVLAGLDADGPD